MRDHGQTLVHAQHSVNRPPTTTGGRHGHQVQTSPNQPETGAKDRACENACSIHPETDRSETLIPRGGLRAAPLMHLGPSQSSPAQARR